MSWVGFHRLLEVGKDVDPARGFYRLNVHRRHLSTLAFKA